MRWSLKHSATLGAIVPFAFLAWLVMSVMAIPVFGSVIGATNQNLSESWDLGDIRGGWSQYTYQDGTNSYTSLAASVFGDHKITNVSINLSPYYWYDYQDGTQHLSGYQVNAYFNGLILSDPLTQGDLGNWGGSNLFDARGLYISEYAATGVFSTGLDPEDGFLAFANASATIRNFNANNAQGRYTENTYEDATYFSYNITWYGNFAEGSTPAGLKVPMMTASAAAPVPEPSGIAMLLGMACPAGGLWWWRKR